MVAVQSNQRSGAVGLKLEDVMFSNADEVVGFIEAHRERKYEVGDSLTLPDIEQTYWVVAARPFTRDGRFYLYLDLEAECAVEGCRNPVNCSVDVALWRNKRHLTRCCPSHRYQFSTPMPGAWMTLEEREGKLDKIEEALRRRKYRERALRYSKAHSRRGCNERAVVEAHADLRLVGAAVPEALLVQAAIAKLERPKGRDTRRQKVVRSIASLRRRGLL